jgi:bifunctional DNA-binding transcriptional regulator/antitoxin component of YhaV-PrlF toxin-antitoxin module
MKMAVKLDPTNRIVLTKAIRETAGIPEGATLTLTATPGVIVIGPEPKRAKIVKKGKIKVLYGNPPSAPVEEDVNASRR